MAVLSLASLILPMVQESGTDAPAVGRGTDVLDHVSSSIPKSLEFTDPVDTNASLVEYPQVARALLLPGGSTDACLGDINADGRTDLIVAVSEAKVISVFYRQVDGTFLSQPSHNVSLTLNPVGVATIDAFDTGALQILIPRSNNNIRECSGYLVQTEGNH